MALEGAATVIVLQKKSLIPLPKGKPLSKIPCRMKTAVPPDSSRHLQACSDKENIPVCEGQQKRKGCRERDQSRKENTRPSSSSSSSLHSAKYKPSSRYQQVSSSRLHHESGGARATTRAPVSRGVVKRTPAVTGAPGIRTDSRGGGKPVRKGVSTRVDPYQPAVPRGGGKVGRSQGEQECKVAGSVPATVAKPQGSCPNGSGNDCARRKTITASRKSTFGCRTFGPPPAKTSKTTVKSAAKPGPPMSRRPSTSKPNQSKAVSRNGSATQTRGPTAVRPKQSAPAKSTTRSGHRNVSKPSADSKGTRDVSTFETAKANSRRTTFKPFSLENSEADLTELMRKLLESDKNKSYSASASFGSTSLGQGSYRSVPTTPGRRRLNASTLTTALTPKTRHMDSDEAELEELAQQMINADCRPRYTIAAAQPQVWGRGAASPRHPTGTAGHSAATSHTPGKGDENELRHFTDRMVSCRGTEKDSYRPVYIDLGKPSTAKKHHQKQKQKEREEAARLQMTPHSQPRRERCPLTEVNSALSPSAGQADHSPFLSQVWQKKKVCEQGKPTDRGKYLDPVRLCSEMLLGPSPDRNPGKEWANADRPGPRAPQSILSHSLMGPPRPPPCQPCTTAGIPPTNRQPSHAAASPWNVVGSDVTFQCLTPLTSHSLHLCPPSSEEGSC